MTVEQRNEKITPEQLRDEWMKERAEIIAEAKAGGWYYPELESDGTTHNENGDTFRTVGGLDYYFLKCKQLGITPKCIESGLSYEASGDGFEFNYCERDNYLTISKKRVAA